MRYFGGKARIAKKIANFLNGVRKDRQVYVEPFVGSANVLCLMDGERLALDFHPDLIMLLKEVQAGTFDYPAVVTEQQYSELKHSQPSALRAFVGFGCSYAGKWFGGYARDGDRNFCGNAASALKKKAAQLQDVNFIYSDYRDIQDLPDGSLIYCDPPYLNHTQIHGQKFDTEEFWDVVRGWSGKHDVYVSEYVAPPDFVSVLNIPTKTDILGSGGQYQRIERLFINRDNTGVA
jgi:DNA adenine methylase